MGPCLIAAATERLQRTAFQVPVQTPAAAVAGFLMKPISPPCVVLQHSAACARGANGIVTDAAGACEFAPAAVPLLLKTSCSSALTGETRCLGDCAARPVTPCCPQESAAAAAASHRAPSTSWPERAPGDDNSSSSVNSSPKGSSSRSNELSDEGNDLPGLFYCDSDDDEEEGQCSDGYYSTWGGDMAAEGEGREGNEEDALQDPGGYCDDSGSDGLDYEMEDVKEYDEEGEGYQGGDGDEDEGDECDSGWSLGEGSDGMEDEEEDEEEDEPGDEGGDEEEGAPDFPPRPMWNYDTSKLEDCT